MSGNTCQERKSETGESTIWSATLTRETAKNSKEEMNPACEGLKTNGC